MAGQAGPQSQPDLCHRPGELHHQDTGELTFRRVVGGKVPPPPSGGIQQFRQVVRVGAGVVKEYSPGYRHAATACASAAVIALIMNCGAVTPPSLRAWRASSRWRTSFYAAVRVWWARAAAIPRDRWGTIASSAVGRPETSKPCPWWSRIRRGGRPGRVNRPGWVLQYRPLPSLMRTSGLPGRCRCSQAPNPDAQLGGAGGSLCAPGHHQHAGQCGGSGQQAPGHRLVAIRPVPPGADGPVEQDHLQERAVVSAARTARCPAVIRPPPDHSSQ
jgi:hypothetical protein